MINYKVPYKLTSPALCDLKYGGAVNEQAEAFFRERVNSDFARNSVYKETEDQFRIRDDDTVAIGYWRGEFWGKWIISACRVAAYQNNSELCEFIRNAAHNLIATADEDGYIGSYRDKTNVFPCDPKVGEQLIGTPCNFNWNVWCRKYTIWGLIEAYMLTHDEEILAATDKTALQLIDMLSSLGAKTSDCGAFNGLPAGSIMKPMLILYRLTGNKKYLDFSLDIANDWEREDGKIPNLITNALSMKPTHEWYPQPEKWAKAYELMSCLDGLLELYRITGTEKYLTVVKNMYELLWTHEQNTLFSVGFNDQFAHGAAWENSLTEPCDVIHWMRVCTELYKLTGDVKYINTVELTFYNPFLASSFKDGTWGARAVRSVGRHMVSKGQAKMKWSHCCVNNVPRGFLNVLECFVLKEGDGLTVNLYTDCTAKTDIADVAISGSYLRDGRVTLEINAQRDITLKLRLPEWAEYVKLDGKELCGNNGYAQLTVLKGKTTLSLEFKLTSVLREMERAPERFPYEDFRVRRFCYDNPVTDDMMTWDRRATLVWGPLLLTRSKLVGNTEEEMFSSESVAGKGYTCLVTPVEADGVNYAFRVKFKNESGEELEMNMCDYASGTNVPSYDDMKLFNVFI